ncbi:MAG TPA: Scr1 family TA system antitoxin-like transcriptional regulator [Trebonia sp.]
MSGPSRACPEAIAWGYPDYEDEREASMPEPDENSAAVRLGAELRQLRIAAGYPTIQALAARIDGYGESLITKVEQGKRTASKQLFPAWLDACAAHIDDKTPVLTDGLRRALTALWELALKREGPIPEFIELWLKREAAATFLRLWALNALPGLLQTYDYAHAMFIHSGLDEDEAAEKAAVRLQRQAILEGPDATQVTTIIYAPVLHSLVGTPAIMARQLERSTATDRSSAFPRKRGARSPPTSTLTRLPASHTRIATSSPGQPTRRSGGSDFQPCADGTQAHGGVPAFECFLVGVHPGAGPRPHLTEPARRLTRRRVREIGHNSQIPPASPRSRKHWAVRAAGPPRRSRRARQGHPRGRHGRRFALPWRGWCRRRWRRCGPRGRGLP